MTQNLENIPRRITVWNVKRIAKIIYSVRAFIKKSLYINIGETDKLYTHETYFWDLKID